MSTDATSESEQVPACENDSQSRCSHQAAGGKTGAQSENWLSTPLAANTISFFSLLVAALALTYGGWQHSQNENNRVARERAEKERDDAEQEFKLSEDSLRKALTALNAGRSVSQETSNLRGWPVATPEDPTLRSRIDPSTLDATKDYVYELDYASIFALYTLVDVLSNPEALNGLKTTKSEFIEENVLPFLFAKASSDKVDVRGSVLYACSRLLDEKHRVEMRSGNTNGGSLQRFGNVFAGTSFKRVEFRKEKNFNLSNLVLDKSVFDHSILYWPVFDNCSLDGMSANHARFRHATLKSIDSSAVSFEGADFKDCSFESCRLPAANFRKSRWHGSTTIHGLQRDANEESDSEFSECDFSGAQIGVDGSARNLIIAKSDFIDAKFLATSGADNTTISACLRHVTFDDINASSSDFTGADVKNVQWKDNCKLSAVKFTSATVSDTEFGEGGSIALDRALFTGAKLDGVVFNGGSAKGISFNNVTCAGIVTFKQTKLAGADFRGSIQENLHFDDAELDWAVLKLDDALIQQVLQSKVKLEELGWVIGGPGDSGAIVVRDPNNAEKEGGVAADASIFVGLAHKGPQFVEIEPINANKLAERLTKMSDERKLEEIVNSLRLNKDAVLQAVELFRGGKSDEAAATLKDTLIKSDWKLHIN